MTRAGIVLRFVPKQRAARPDPPPRPRPPCRYRGCPEPADWLHAACAAHLAVERQAIIRGQQERARRRTAVATMRQLGAPTAVIARHLGVSAATVGDIGRRIARDAARRVAPEVPPTAARARMLHAAACAILAALDPLDPEP